MGAFKVTHTCHVVVVIVVAAVGGAVFVVNG